MKLTVGIKALNEEKHIEEAIQSALRASEFCESEVILADSGSTDATLGIASKYPVRIVQLSNVAERSCGAGAQLAFQHATGRYFYLLDGDMVLDIDFIRHGIEYLEANPEVAAVGGFITERNLDGEDFQVRVKTALRDRNWATGYVDRLDSGGLYRSDAVKEVGYFADRNLHAFEEFDLGARLSTAHWKMARIDKPAVEHYGHVMGGYSLLWRRFKTGYSGATGEVLRGAFGRPHLGFVLKNLGHVRHCTCVVAWWIALVFALFAYPVIFLPLLLLPACFLSYRRGSFRLGLYSFASWNVNALGLCVGLFKPRVEPSMPLASRELSGAQRRFEKLYGSN